ncbi:carboxyl-terminal processing protease CtpA [Thermocoleostomius sinensis]|jgi:carboxyl-terminal processing protease|uniref:Carboxyl-terminal-processing protease n=1 Tax=Thermocoleostomius sinensis A174 TaxID=2016057 RepID=A0A9E8ZJ25_9CYAN|nr:carboxyl-terminal processing protease CtpA [Thermocoleostomius sinensis]WAL59411.1 S41 family peptidase [Thermocoleostomius sinensis A174]
MRKRIVQIGLVLLPIALALLCLVPTATAFSEEQRLVNEVWRIVDRAYLDDTFNHQNWWQVRQQILRQPLDTREKAYTEIQKMLSSLGDPFTRLLKPEQYRSLQTNTSGELTGVGLQITQDVESGSLRVIAPIEGSPAELAGIKSRDRIVKINGISTVDLTLDEAAERMRGPIGSQVTLSILHEDSETIEDINVVRDRISLNPVYADLRSLSNDLNVGYIRLMQFNANATLELSNAIKRLEDQGANAYILDLRSNPGGLLQAGIEIARLWLNEGTVVYTVNRNGIQDSFTANGQALTDDPLIVLVNQGTASASEILAGALQDNHRAQLVGERTFGKGLIQSLFSLSDGSGLAVTIAKYETPAHHDINRQGIVPDVEVPLEPITRDQIGTDADRQYQTAIEVLSRPSVVADAG